MSDWREPLLKPLVPGIARKTVVSDPDGLFRDDQIYRVITDRGFALIYYEEPISFRFTYESEFREKWDRGENRELVVVLVPDTHGFDKLPADVLQNARQLAFYLKDVFPNLSYTVVSKLDRVYFDILYRAHSHYAKHPLGDALTREFILKHVFETVPELIKKDSDLLRTLLQRHYRKQQIPAPLDDYFLSILKKINRFKDWPLNAIVPDRGAFWDFLQERWPLFVNRDLVKSIPLAAEPTSFKYTGAYDLPFNHDDIRVYIENLFTEGILQPIGWNAEAVKAKPWVQIGLKGGPPGQTEIRFDDLRKGVEENAPRPEANVSAWLAFAHPYGQMQRVWNEHAQALKPVHGKHYEELRTQLNQRFATWLSTGYRGIFNYPAVNPVMVHHIPGFLANCLEKGGAKRVAFVLIDGMAMAQWLMLRDSLSPVLEDARMQENALMAWIPTITPVSRQAAFSGKIPVYLTDTIFQTNRDDYGWRQFWSDRGFQLDEVATCAVHGEASDLEQIDSLINHRIRVFGCTVFKIDKIMHGVQVGAAGMAAQVKVWAGEGFLAGLVKRLIGEGFHVFLSADHGNVVAQGIGTPKEGVLSDTKGQRCRIYSDPKLRASTQADFPDSIAWDHQGLPKDFHCLLAPPDKAFVLQGQTIVTHGGSSLDEVIVPFIEISRKKTVY
jgi:hypothetical protein